MKIAFAGTAEFAADALRALKEAGHEVALVLTKPDQPGRRGLALQASPVKKSARALGLDVLEPRSLRLDGKYPEEAARAKEALDRSSPEAWVVAAYGLMLPRWALDLPRHGCLNIHASLLPRWRGAAPIQRAIEAGDESAGVCLMKMEEGLDTGPVMLRSQTPIFASDTFGSLERRLAAMGAGQAVKGLSLLAAGKASYEAQPEEGAVYAAKVLKEEALVDWNMTAEQLERLVRALSPAPGMSAMVGAERVKIWSCGAELGSDVKGEGAAPGTVLESGPNGLLVACAAGAIRVSQMQRPGGKRLASSELLRSWGPKFGQKLG